MKIKKDFLTITDLSSEVFWEIFAMAKKLKEDIKHSHAIKNSLQNKSLVMIFEKPSLRTRLSFEIGISKLGGHAVYLAPSDIGLGTRESVADVAKVASSMGEVLMARTFAQQTVEEMAKYATVPVINGLSDLEHPCQALADLMTIWEIKGDLKGLKIAYIGDGENNVTHSLCLGSALLGLDFSCASPEGYWMNPEIIDKAKKIAEKTNVTILETSSPEEAVKDADVVYTDKWYSMGEEDEKKEREKLFILYQITQLLMNQAKKNAVFMHDLPAERGSEVATEVIDGQQSVVFQQAENRMWAQMALILHLLKD